MIIALDPLAPNPENSKDFPGAEKLSHKLVEKYAKVAEPKIQSLEKIQQSQFLSQKTEIAGAILNLISQEPIKEVRVILMSVLLHRALRSDGLGGMLAQLLGGRARVETLDPEKCAKCEHLDCPKHPQHAAEAVAP